MDALSLGPLLFPAGALYLILSLLLFFTGAELAQFLRQRRLNRQPASGQTAHSPNTAKARPDLSNWSQHCLWAGLVAGRLVYVARHSESFSHDWLSVLYFWQPGYSVSAALAAAAAVTLYQLRQPKLISAALAWLVCCSLIWLLLHSWAPLSRDSNRALPDLTLPTLAYPSPDQPELSSTPQAVPLIRHQGPLILNLWASWCGPCRREMPVLTDFARGHPQLTVWLVNQGESPLQVQRFIDNQDEPIPAGLILLDPNQSLMQAIGGAGLPITLAYNRGRLIDSHIGELNPARLAEMARAISAD